MRIVNFKSHAYHIFENPHLLRKPRTCPIFVSCQMSDPQCFGDILFIECKNTTSGHYQNTPSYVYKKYSDHGPSKNRLMQIKHH
jgi:hypothetical protein